MPTFLRAAAARCGGRCQLSTIGNSYQGRPLLLLKITDGSGNTTRPAAWVDGGMHSREWLALATVLYIVDRLVDDYAWDVTVRQMVAEWDWHVLACANPDGYVYSWTTDRMWRKTRRPTPGTGCVGTDPNRNFNHRWGTVGVSQDPCSDIYPGPYPYSEPETRALAGYMRRQAAAPGRGPWRLFLTIHTYGQYLLMPWGYTDTPPSTYTQLQRVGEAMKKAFNDTHGKSYFLGQSAKLLYKSSGTSRDWAYGVMNISYAYTLELRSYGSFIVPPQEIVPTGEETWNALKAAFKEITKES